jgi:hypothetical protein
MGNNIYAVRLSGKNKRTTVADLWQARKGCGCHCGAQRQ